MHSQCPSTALLQDLEVAARLRGLDRAETVPGPGDRQVEGISAGDLQEDAGVRSAFVGLAGRVQEARTKAYAGCHTLRVADCVTQQLQRAVMGVVRLDIGQDGEIIARSEPVQVRSEIAGEVRSAPVASFSAAVFRSSLNSVMPRSCRIGASGGNEPVFSYSAVNVRVAILLASTSGWLNGLMPRIDRPLRSQSPTGRIRLPGRRDR